MGSTQGKYSATMRDNNMSEKKCDREARESERDKRLLPRGGVSKKLCEFVHGDTCLTNDSAQGAPIELLMVWNDKLGERLPSSKYHVASFSTSDDEPCFLKRLDTFSP